MDREIKQRYNGWMDGWIGRDMGRQRERGRDV